MAFTCVWPLCYWKSNQLSGVCNQKVYDYNKLALLLRCSGKPHIQRTASWSKNPGLNCRPDWVLQDMTMANGFLDCSCSVWFLYPAIRHCLGIMISEIMMSSWISICVSVSLPVRPSIVHPSIFCFWMITWVNIYGFLANLVYALMW